MRNFLISLAVLVSMGMFASSAQAAQAAKQSPLNWTAHVGFGFYTVDNISDEFDSGTDPAKSIFGDTLDFTFQMGLERLLYKGVGTVGVEGTFGFYQTSGKGLFEDGQKSSDSTDLNLFPFRLSAVYRFTWLWEEFKVPVAPTAKFGFDYTIWWITDQKGDVAKWTKPGGGTAFGRGGTFGLHVSYGLMFCLDIVDSRLANEFDQDVGVNNTWLFVEGTYAWINDFGSSSSFDLSSHFLLAGLLFEF